VRAPRAVALVATLVAVASVASAPVAGALGAETASAQAASEGPPDIVLIVTDDQRWDTLWAMPTVSERLAVPGVTFSEAFVVNPLCCPSRASILTGNYSHTHLVYRQDPPFGRFDWFDDSSTLATWLDEAGYRTGLFGKYIDGGQHAAVTGYVPPGWDRWVAFVHAEMFDYGLTFDGTVRRFGTAPEDHSTEVLADEAVAFVRESEGPLFLVYAPAVPHAPAIPSPGDEDALAELAPARPASFDEPDVSDKPAWVRDLPRLTADDRAAIDAFRRQQYGSLLGVDRAVGEILHALRASGRLENALIVFTSDNGILHGEHRWTKKEAPYEEAIRVPLVLRWDAAGWKPRTESALALNIDLAPTIADAAGVATPSTDGESLLPLLEGRSSTWRRDFLIEHLEGTNPVTTYCAVRSARWKYVRYATGEEELYDLDADPLELENLAARSSGKATLDGFRTRLRELCVPPPPGYGDRSETRVPLLVGALFALIAFEIVASRRSRSSRSLGSGGPSVG
jgi:N-acetylglucosamine-6-sulfatase